MYTQAKHITLYEDHEAGIYPIPATHLDGKIGVVHYEKHF